MYDNAMNPQRPSNDSYGDGGADQRKEIHQLSVICEMKAKEVNDLKKQITHSQQSFDEQFRTQKENFERLLAQNQSYERHQVYEEKIKCLIDEVDLLKRNCDEYQAGMNKWQSKYFQALRSDGPGPEEKN